MWLLFCGMSIDAGIALGIFCHKLTINIKNVLTNIKSEIVVYKKGYTRKENKQCLKERTEIK